MTGPQFALLFNTLVAMLFAATFLLMSRLNAGLREIRWFALSYAVGALTPISELLVSAVPPTPLWMMTSYASFATALTISFYALHRYFGAPISWRLPVALVAGAVCLRLSIWGGQRDDLAYELAYQAPSVMLTALCAATVARVSPRGLIDWALAGAFALTCVHFMAKPFIAAAVGSGATAVAYSHSLYAMYSQAGTGILLIATGLVLTMVLLRDASVLGRRAAEIDALSGVLNRRGFDEQAAQVLAATRRPSAVLMVDIDHFKLINDTFGHAAGDNVIAVVAATCRELLPTATIGRIGGEEFAIVLPLADERSGRLAAEALRAAVAGLSAEGVPDSHRITASVGLALHAPGETLRASMMRADGALYRAKREGRDRVSIAEASEHGLAGTPAARTS